VQNRTVPFEREEIQESRPIVLTGFAIVDTLSAKSGTLLFIAAVAIAHFAATL
jgi:hypothetical protein